MNGRGFLRHRARAVGLAVLALLLVTASAYAAPSAAGITQYVVKGSSAEADASSYSACGYTALSIYPFSWLQLGSDPSSSQPTLIMGYQNYDYCAGTWFWGYTFVGLPADAFQVANNGTSASLRPMSVTMQNLFGPDTKTFTVSATWTGDPTTTTRSRYSSGYTQPGISFQQQGTGLIISANVAITLLDGSTDVTPRDYQWGIIRTSMEGAVEVNRR